MKVPEIDKRSKEDIVDRTQALVEDFTSEVKPTLEALTDRILDQDIIDPELGEIIANRGDCIDEKKAERISGIESLSRVKVKPWKASEDKASEHSDASSALIHIFARMVELTSRRLNKAPEKNFLAFLDLIGTEILPPQPARVPLTFHLATGSPSDVVVPAHTPAAAPPAEGETEETVFETDSELVVTSAQLTSVFVRDRYADRYADYTEEALDVGDKSFPAFSGDRPIAHILYLACDDFFTLPDSKTVTLAIYSPDAARLAALPITWYYWDSSNIIKGLTVKFTSHAAQVEVAPGIAVDAQGQKIEFSSIQTVDLSKYKGSIVFLVVSYRKKSSVISILAEAEASNYPAETYIRLARLRIDTEGQVSNFVTSSVSTSDQWQVTIADLPVPAVHTINGKEAAWLEARLEVPDGSQASQFLTPNKLPRINYCVVTVNVKQSGLAPNLGFTNVLPLDLSKDFYPFGEKPSFNDTLYLSSQKAFSRPGSRVRLNVKLTEPLPLPINPSPDLEIAWEVWDGRVWQLVGKSVPNNSQSNPGFIDTTQAFTKSGGVEFTLPSEMGAGTVNGETNYWVRARIVKGNYDTGAAFGQTDTYSILTENSQDTDPNERKIIKVNSVRGFLPGDRIFIASSSEDQKEAEIETINWTENKFTIREALTNNYPTGTSVMLQRNASFGPPSIASLTLSYEYEQSGSLSACQTYNDFTYAECTAEATAGGSGFQPFTSTNDEKPSLYLGFDQAFSNRPVTLYVSLDPIRYQHGLNRQDLVKNPALIIWEYFSSSSSDWSPLRVQDETHAFTRRGLITFIAPPDFQQSLEFGRSGYWLRVRREQEKFPAQPRLRHLLLNTTWATQVTTLKNEILGSSNGQQNQVFRTTKAPVLEGQQIEVLEKQMPSSAQQKKIKDLEGEDALTQNLDDMGQLQSVWVRWHQVPNFYTSQTWDRHYVLDRLTGEVRFGDNQQGMVPPHGRHNIRATYRTGGGQRGNQPAGTIIQLKSTVPYVDRVTNYEAAGGGAEAETLEAVKERGPKVLRHRHRAVTAQDFEDLAQEASPGVARAKAITPHSSNGVGQVELIIVPLSNDPTPTPSLDLLERVEDYIRPRCAPTLELRTSGPDWVEITVEAKVVPRSLSLATNLEVTVMNALQSFLHPLTGGWDGRGWVFGRKPHKSDFYNLLESIEGVEYVETLSVEEQREKVPPERQDCFLVSCGHHSISIIRPAQEGE